MTNKEKNNIVSKITGAIFWRQKCLVFFDCEAVLGIGINSKSDFSLNLVINQKRPNLLLIWIFFISSERHACCTWHNNRWWYGIILILKFPSVTCWQAATAVGIFFSFDLKIFESATSMETHNFSYSFLGLWSHNSLSWIVFQSKFSSRIFFNNSVCFEDIVFFWFLRIIL